MANGIVGGLENVLGLNTTAGSAELQQALTALQAVNVPDLASLTLPELQKYVAAGVLTPSQYQAISADPQAFQQIANSADQTGTNAQKQALQQLSGIVSAGGSTPINQATLLNNVNQTNQAMQAARSGIMENAQQRGVAGGGLEFINQLANEQGNAQNANLNAVNAASDNAKLALQAMTQGGQLGGQLQGQENAQALAKAQAAQQIAEYNSQLQSAANQYNTQNANTAQATNLANAQNISNQNVGNANQRTMYNAQLPGQEFNMKMQKAGGLAGAYGNLGNLKQQQATGENQFIGGLIGAGATMGGDYMLGQGMAKSGAMKSPGYGNGPPAGVDTSMYAPPNYGYAHGGEVGYNQGGMCYAQGGEVHDHALCMVAGGPVPGDAEVPGDSTQNDTVDAKLSPHEIVLPRSIAQSPDAPQQAAQFVGGIKGQPAPLDFGAIVKQLEDNGLELRLCPKGY